mmetsp:Transcript_1448/g.2592  ORF Transcript_1448/g.2592 Transcript_1448/m.2592 type:complete len:100 (+) Transcript_1448:199-498(+)
MSCQADLLLEASDLARAMPHATAAMYTPKLVMIHNLCCCCREFPLASAASLQICNSLCRQPADTAPHHAVLTPSCPHVMPSRPALKDFQPCMSSALLAT